MKFYLPQVIIFYFGCHVLNLVNIVVIISEKSISTQSVKPIVLIYEFDNLTFEFSLEVTVF